MDYDPHLGLVLFVLHVAGPYFTISLSSIREGIMAYDFDYDLIQAFLLMDTAAIALCLHDG